MEGIEARSPDLTAVVLLLPSAFVLGGTPKMPTQRQQQVSELLREQISLIMQRRLKDPRLGLVSITQVLVAPDLRDARVFIDSLGDETAGLQAARVLQGAAGFIQAELGRNLHLRRVPRLDFRYDAALSRGDHVLDLIDKIAKEEKGESLAREQPEASPKPEGDSEETSAG